MSFVYDYIYRQVINICQQFFKKKKDKKIYKNKKYIVKVFDKS